MNVNMKSLLIIYPQFSVNFDNFFKDYDSITYDESLLISSNKILKILQGLFYIIDIFLPRKFAISSVFRLIRNTNCEEFWTKIFTDNKIKLDQARKVVVIKGYGLTSRIIPQEISVKFCIILWDSLARYRHMPGMEKFYIATTSPYDSIQHNLRLIHFYPRNPSTKSENLSFNSFFYIGRFTLVRFCSLCRLYLLADRKREFRIILSPAPFSFQIGSISVIKKYYTEPKLISETELVVNDLNEDSPSLRVDSSENAPVFVVNNPIVKSMFPSKDLFQFFFSIKKFCLLPKELSVKNNLSVISFNTLVTTL